MTPEEYLINRLTKEASYHLIEAQNSYNAAVKLSGGMEKTAFLEALLTPQWLIPLGISTGFQLWGRNKMNAKIQNDIANANMLAKQQSDYIKKLEAGLVPAGKQLTPLQIGGAAAIGASIPIVAGKLYDRFFAPKKQEKDNNKKLYRM